MHAQLVNLIIAGCSKEQIQQISGLSNEAYEEALASPELLQAVRTRKEEMREEEIEKEYSSVELKALRQVKDTIAFADPTQACKILETVSRNRVARKQVASGGMQNNGHFTNPTVGIQVILPTFLANQGTKPLVLDSKNQVIAIEGRSMAPLPTSEVHKLFSELKEKRTLEAANEPDPIEQDYDERHATTSTSASASA